MNRHEIINISMDYTEVYSHQRTEKCATVWYKGIKWGIPQLADFLKCSQNQVIAIVNGDDIPPSRATVKEKTKSNRSGVKKPSVCFKGEEVKSFRTRGEMADFLGVFPSTLSTKIKTGGKIKGWHFL